MKKILIFNPFGIGDVIFSTPLIRNLKSAWEGVSLTYLCNARTQRLLQKNPFIDEVVVFEKDYWRQLARESKTQFMQQMIAFFRQIRSSQFDAAIDLSMNSQYGFFLKIAGIRQRVGFDFKKRGRFLTQRIPLPRGYQEKHVARYYLDLLHFFGIDSVAYPFELSLPEESLQRVRALLVEAGIQKGTKIIVVCPGSGDSWQDTAYFKRWPQEYFSVLSRQLQEEGAGAIVLGGSSGEWALCQSVQEGLANPVLNLCGKLALDEFCALISCADVVITNDGGPFHIAQALETVAIAFYGPVDEKVYGAYPDASKKRVLFAQVPCRPCYQAFKFKGCAYDKRCLRQIGVQEALIKVHELLESQL